MKEKKIKLNEDSEALREFQEKVLNKSHALRSLVGYISQFVGVDETTFFNGNLKENVINLFKAKYANDFPSYISTLKIMELVEFSMTTFENLLEKYNSFDVADYDPINQQAKVIDFAVYAETPEQIQRYHESKSIVDELNKLGVKVATGTMARQTITQLIPIVGYNRFKNVFEVNVRYVLGQ